MYVPQVSAVFAQLPPCVSVHVLDWMQLFATPWAVAPRLLCPWDFPGKNTGVSCHFLLQGIFPTQDQILISCVSFTGGWILYHCTTWKPMY